MLRQKRELISTDTSSKTLLQSGSRATTRCIAERDLSSMTNAPDISGAVRIVHSDTPFFVHTPFYYYCGVCWFDEHQSVSLGHPVSPQRQGSVPKHLCITYSSKYYVTENYCNYYRRQHLSAWLYADNDNTRVGGAFRPSFDFYFGLSDLSWVDKLFFVCCQSHHRVYDLRLCAASPSNANAIS